MLKNRKEKKIFFKKMVRQSDKRETNSDHDKKKDNLRIYTF